MKYSVLIVFTLLLMQSCDKMMEPQESYTRSEFIMRSENLEIIKNYIDINHGASTRSGEYIIVPYIIDKDTVMYVANYKNGGFEIFSNNKSLPLVIAKSKTGNFFPGNISSCYNTPFDLYLGLLGSDLTSRFYQNDMVDETWDFYSLKNSPGKRISNESMVFVGHAKETIRTEYAAKGGRLSTKWDQGNNYNQYIPFYENPASEHALAGCAAVAAGQYIYHSNKYFGKPVSAPSGATYDSASNTYSFWGLSKDVWQSMDDGNNKTFYLDEFKMQSTAIFIGNIAKSVNTIFGKQKGQGSGALDEDMIDYVNQQCGLNLNFHSYTFNDAVKVLKSGRPVLVSSNGLVDMSGWMERVGHAYIIDYAEYNKETYYEVYANRNGDPDSPDPGEDIDQPEGEMPSLEDMRLRYGDISYTVMYSDSYCWVKMNWGWRGEYDSVLFNGELTEWMIFMQPNTLKLSQHLIAY